MQEPTAGALGTLACDLGRRPPGAPTFADLAASVRTVEREGACLVVAYEPAVAARLAALGAAERLCCPGLAWEVDAGATTLRVTAGPDQLDALEQIVRLDGRPG